MQDQRTRALLQKLSGNDHVEDLLGRGRVRLILSAQDLTEPFCQLCAFMTVNLLARLHPVVKNLEIVIPNYQPLTVSLPRWGGETIGASIQRFLEELHPPLSWRIGDSAEDSEVDCTLAVGRADVDDALFVGGERWTARFSPHSPVLARGEANPVGAFAAAVIGASEVWKCLLAPYKDLFPNTPVIPTIDDLTFSTFDHSTNSDDIGPSLPDSFELALTIIGLGAGGAAALFTLAALAVVRGELNIVEPDIVTVTNLNRLVFAGERDIDARKVELGRSIVDHHVDLAVEGWPEPIDNVKLPIEALENVVAAVHSRAARNTIQFETPKVLWDGAAGSMGEFKIWRVDFGTTQCLGCKQAFEGRDPEHEQAEQLAQELGLTANTWYEKIRDNSAFTEAEVEEIKAYREQHRKTEEVLPNIGEPYGDWEAEKCGVLKLAEFEDEEIPIPFAPVMAGILLAGEIIKELAFPDAALRGCYGNSLVGVFSTRSQTVMPDRHPECAICQDPSLLRQYKRRWNS